MDFTNYEQTRDAYKAMTPQDQKAFVEQNRSNPEFQNFVMQYGTEVSQQMAQKTPEAQKDYSQLKDPNQSLEYYGDDSSADNYQYMWWKAPKYQGEWVRTSDLDYNKNITTKDLQGERYWWASQQYGSQNPWYISRRNDNIASALYNEGRITREDVQDFLESQEWFWDSTPEERENTIESIWKRLGTKWEWLQEQPQQKDIFMWDREDDTWKLYWKNWPDTSRILQGTDTYGDDLSIWKSMQAARKANYDALNHMDNIEIAAMLYSWKTPYWEQAMRDLSVWNPAKYQEVQAELKKLYWEDVINSISEGEAWIWNKFIESIEKTIESDKTDWVDSNSNERTAEWVKSMLDVSLESNQVAQNAKQEMMNINKDLAEIQNQIENLPLVARKVFKWDTPQDIVNAFINNQTQKLQNEASKLESRFNAAAEIYKTELANTQWELEYKLKKDEFEESKNQFRMNYAIQKEKATLDAVHWVNDGKGWVKWYKIVNWQIVEISDGTAYNQYQSQVELNVQSALEMAKNNADYWECEEFTDDLTEASAWVRMVWIGEREWLSSTTAEEKAWYATQFDTFSDYIPQVWDVAVQINNWSNKVNKKRWHTMYVVWYDENTWMVSLVWSNGLWDLHHKVYSQQMSLSEFYWVKWWVWFWNPYKYAQRAAMASSWNQIENMYSPMQDTIDNLLAEYKASWKTNMFDNLWQFQEAYTLVYQDMTNWNLSELLDSWAIWDLFRKIALDYANQYNETSWSWKEKISWAWNAIAAYVKLSAEEALAYANNYFNQQVWWAEEQKAWEWFLTLMRIVEIKLRDESGAAINQSEWWTNFMEYVPQAWDTSATKEKKLNMMEEYIRRLATQCWIDSKQYKPIMKLINERDINDYDFNWGWYKRNN